MKDRYQLALGFSQIAEALRIKFRRPGDVEGELVSLKFLEQERPQNKLLQLRYDEMKDAFVEIIDLMWRNQNPMAMLVAFEKAIACQEMYHNAHVSAFNRGVHKIQSGKT